MKKKLTVSVGIAAYNEEKNIKKLLLEVLKQREVNWKLNEILLFSDGSKDRTVSSTKEINSKVIKIFEYEKQKGKVARIQEACEKFKSEILIILDADLKLKDRFVLDELIKPFLYSNKVALTGGNTRPFHPETFFERAVYSTFEVFDNSRIFLKNGNNIFGCNGGCIAIHKRLAKKIKFPNIVNEDDYLYFSCLKNKYKFKHVRSAVVYYKLPKNLRDYLKQSFRSNPEAVSQNFTKYFGKLVLEEYNRPKFFYLNNILKVFLKEPIETMFIIIVNIICKPFYPIISKNYKIEWYRASSTK